MGTYIHKKKNNNQKSLQCYNIYMRRSRRIIRIKTPFPAAAHARTSYYIVILYSSTMHTHTHTYILCSRLYRSGVSRKNNNNHIVLLYICVSVYYII